MFGFHPVVLAFRFVLEVAALAAISVGGYMVGSGAFAWILAVTLPIVAAVVWGTFNVPGDQSRSGEAPVAVSGRTRLFIEFGMFGLATVFAYSRSPITALMLGTAVTLHYLLSFDRIRWLLRN